MLFPPARQFQALPQPRQRRSQVVSDVARHLLQAQHQILDPVEHRVQAATQVVELVVGPAQRHPLGQVARHDRSARPAHHLHPAQHAVAHGKPAGDGQHDSHAQPEQRGAQDDLPHLTELVVADTNKQIRAVRQHNATAPNAADRSPFRRLVHPFQRPQAWLWLDRRHIARNHLAVRRLQQVVDARRIHGQPGDHPLQHLGILASRIGLNLRQLICHRRVELLGHEAAHQPSNDGEHHQPGHAEHGRIQHGQPEAGGAKRPRQAHEGNTRCRARC